MQAIECVNSVFPGLNGLERGLSESLAGISRIIDLAADTILCRQGARPQALHWLIGGQVALAQDGAGEPAIIDIVQPVNGISLASAMLGQPYAITARSITPAQVMAVDAAALRELAGVKPALASTMMQAMSQEIVSATRQVIDLKTRKAAERLASYLLSLVDDPDSQVAAFRLPFQKSMLAGKIGCRQENLSRAFATLREFGVETHGARVILHNIPLLNQFAGRKLPIRSAVAEAFSQAFDLSF